MSFVGRGVSLTRPVLQSISSLTGSGVTLTRPRWNLSRLSSGGESLLLSLTRPVLVCLVLGLCEFLLHTACWNLQVRFAVGGLSYQNLSRRSAGGDFLLHVLCWKLSGLSSGGEYI